jgi:hypothetical protein
VRLLVNCENKENNLNQYVPRICNKYKNNVLVLLKLKALIVSD